MVKPLLQQLFCEENIKIMVNVLLNYYNFDGEWARKKLTPYVRGKVLIIPLAFREWEINDEVSWQAIYGEGGEKHDNIMRPFYAYGIEPSDIKWLDYFDKSVDHTAELAEADVLFFTGGMPEKAVARIDELGLRAAIQNFDGVVMGASAGAMLQLARYHVTPDEDYAEYGLYDGLGLVRGIDLEVHFLDTELQNACTERATGDLGLPVCQMWHEGGVLVEGNNVVTMGHVRIVK